MQLSLPRRLQMFKLTLPDTIIARGSWGILKQRSAPPRKMKGRWNELKFLCETVKINSALEMAPTVHREGLCDFSGVRAASADVQEEAGARSHSLSLSLSLHWRLRCESFTFTESKCPPPPPTPGFIRSMDSHRWHALTSPVNSLNDVQWHFVLWTPHIKIHCLFDDPLNPLF